MIENTNELDTVANLCHEVADMIMEHAESVRIFVTIRGERGDTTQSFTHGKGNWHAQRGQVAHWKRQEDERDREELRMEVNYDDGEEGFKDD